jgi:hypothetical protein
MRGMQNKWWMPLTQIRANGVEDTRQMLQFLSRWECVFTKQAANKAAHRLAKRTISNASDRIWRNQIPDCISDIVLMKQVVSSY